SDCSKAAADLEAAAAAAADSAAGGSLQQQEERQRKVSGDAADTDSGRPTSVDDEEEDEPGLVLHIPPRPDSSEIKDQSGSREEGKEEGKIKDRPDGVRRIPTLVCEELRDEEEPDDMFQPSSSSSRRVHRRALSKQCVIDDDTVTQQQANCIVSSPRREATAKEKTKTTLSPTPPPPPLTADQWESMAERRRELAAQLLGRTPLTLSQSEGNLERAKTLPSNPSKSGGNTKQLVRSHALCGDDDTRLRPPAEFARSNPSFAATKSLSRDSSATDYTDSSGVDLFTFICATLHKNEKDRSILLELEKQLLEFLKDDNRQSYKFAPMSSYNRMLIHRVAAYFGLDHNIDQSGQSIVVNRNDNTRIPDHSFSSLIKSNIFTDTARRSLSRDAQSYEEIREYPSLPHRMSLEMISRRTRSFEVSAKRTLSPAWRNDHNAQSMDAAPPPNCSSPYTLSPVMQNSAEVPDERVETHVSGTRGAGLAQLHKAGSFGGVPVFYRNNSNGVRPVEEMRGRPRNGTAQIRSESQRSRPNSQNGMMDPPDYYGSGATIPPDPYYREDFRPEFNGNTMPQHAYFQTDPNRLLYIDTYGAPAVSPQMDCGAYYYAAPVSQPLQPVQQQYVQQPQQTDQVDQLAHEMSGASISSSHQSPSPPQQPLPATRPVPAPVPYYSPVPAPVPMMHSGFYAPVYPGYAMPFDSPQPLYFTPVHYPYQPAPVQFQPTVPMTYHNGTTYYTNGPVIYQNYGGYYGTEQQYPNQVEETEPEPANGQEPESTE
ncbi:hypothetical protein PENTCL1PPCAC_12011, partial [Pristionchus entomophagus]